MFTSLTYYNLLTLTAEFMYYVVFVYRYSIRVYSQGRYRILEFNCVLATGRPLPKLSNFFHQNHDFVNCLVFYPKMKR